MNPEKTGTKAAAHYRLTVPAGRVRGRSAAADRRRARRSRPSQRQRARRVRQPFRRGAAGAPQRGRRVLRRQSFPRSLDADAANVMRQALAGMLWSKQFYHYDVDKWLEERGSDPFKPTRKARAAQRALAPHVQRRRHLHAGQVGVSLVRRLGPRLPRPAADAGGPGFRQAATQADAARDATCTPTARSRPTSGTSATSTRRCMPGPPSSPTAWKRRARARATSTGSRAASRSCCSTSPGGSTARTARAERLRGRLPGPRQHRRVRPQRAAADRRLPGTGRRHRLDGALLPEHARDRRRAGDDRRRLRGHGAQVRRALPVDRLGDDARGRRHRHVGRGGRLLLRRAPVARRPGPAAQGPLDGGPAAALRGHGVRGRIAEEVSRDRGSGLQGFLEARPGVGRRHPRPDEARRRGPPARRDPGRNQAPPRAGEDARRERVPQPVRHPLALALPRRSSLRRSTSGGQEYRVSYLPASPTPACSAATRTGAGRSGCRSTP